MLGSQESDLRSLAGNSYGLGAVQFNGIVEFTECLSGFCHSNAHSSWNCVYVCEVILGLGLELRASHLVDRYSTT
jgi:hypothetical protein